MHIKFTKIFENLKHFIKNNNNLMKDYETTSKLIFENFKKFCYNNLKIF